MRVNFNEIFQLINNHIVAKMPVRVCGIMTQPGSMLIMGNSCSGIQLTQHIGNDLEVVEEDGGVITVRGVYE